MMKKLFAKKQLMMVALIAALGVAVYLNYYLTNEQSLAAGTPGGSSAIQQEDVSQLGEATFVGATTGDASGTTTKPAQGDASYFDTARNNRTAAREEALSILQEVLDNAKSTDADKKAATQQAAAIAENVLQESNVENLIVAKGFGDSVVFIDGDKCSVVVKSEDLQRQESLQILEIVVSQTGVAPERVQIVTANT